MDTCATDVASCDFTQSPDEVFATCKLLKATDKPKPVLRQFQGSVTGANTSTYHINQTTGGNGPFVLFIAPQFDGDYSGWACYYVLSYLATQGIAVFTADIPDPDDANRDNWNRVPSSGVFEIYKSDFVLKTMSFVFKSRQLEPRQERGRMRIAMEMPSFPQTFALKQQTQLPLVNDGFVC